MEETIEQEILQRLTSIETKIDNGIISKLEDHEKRVRFLERGYFVAFGVLVVLQVFLRFLK